MTNHSSEDVTHKNTFYFMRGRVALCAILRALKLRPGDEVLLQAFTCLAVPCPIVGLGLKPVYVDVDPHTCNMNPESLAGRITTRSRAIVVQHSFGIPAPMNAILKLARKYGLAVVEDCCHVLGSRYEGQDLGTFGDAAFYSYEWGKPIIIGVGGAAVIHSQPILEALESSYSQYLSPRTRELTVVNIQYAAHSLIRRPALFWTMRAIYRFLSKSGLIVSSFRDEEFEGRLNREYETRMAGGLVRRLRAKSRVSAVRQSIEHRLRLGNRYEHLARELGLAMAIAPNGSETVYLRFPLYARDKARVLRSARDSRIEMGDWFSSPVHPLAASQWPMVGYLDGCCPVAERLSGTLVTLPVNDMIGTRDAERTLDFLERIANEELLERESERSSDEFRTSQHNSGVLQ